MTKGARKHRTDISCAFMHDSMGIPVRIQFTDGNVQSRRYNFSIEREKRKLSCSSEREKNRPKVNGKEFDKMHGLNTYDYGARQYNPVTARWDRVAPLCEKYYSVSPYAYCRNNSVMYIDPDGRDGLISIYGNWKFRQTLYPISSDEFKRSTNNNIRININALGNINQRSCGIAHEFGHVILYLNGQPHSHSKNGDFIYGRQWNVMERFGYDYLESSTGKIFK